MCFDLGFLNASSHLCFRFFVCCWHTLIIIWQWSENNKTHPSLVFLLLLLLLFIYFCFFLSALRTCKFLPGVFFLMLYKFLSLIQSLILSFNTPSSLLYLFPPPLLPPPAHFALSSPHPPTPTPSFNPSVTLVSMKGMLGGSAATTTIPRWGPPVLVRRRMSYSGLMGPTTKRPSLFFF